MDTHKEGAKSANPLTGLPGAVFENAWQLRWGVKLLFVCLFMDAVTAYGMHRSLKGLSADTSVLWSNLGAIFEASTLFCLLVSFVVPFAAGFIRVVGILLPWHWLSNPNTSLNFGCVLFGDMRDHCLQTGDEFAWKIYNEAESRHSEWQRTRQQAGVLIFGLITFLIVNFWSGVHYDVLTIGVELVSLIEGPGCALLGLATISGLHWAWWESQPLRQIYYPPLAEQLRVKRNLAKGDH